ncbi:MAG: homoserine dehydrogenase [Thermodesulfobacteriota bacterium]
MEKINVGLIGFGTVGTGVVKILKDNAGVLRDKLGCEVILKKVADRDTKRDRGVELEKGVLVSDASEILNDPEISIVIELIGGTTAAKDITLEALKKGKHVATANKALLSTHAREIFEAAAKGGLNIGFEASVAGGIPIIKALREGLAANRIESMYGIINGTANYILTKMSKEGGKFEGVLAQAQKKGYAEADPAYDVDGIDTAHKLAILIDLAYGTFVSLDDIYTEGISNITEIDIKFAEEFGYVIKLLAIAKAPGGVEGGIEARVHPTMIPLDHPLASVDGVFNAVHLKGDAVGSTMFYGMGAGMMPTASAVVADVVDICRDILKGCPGRLSPLGHTEGAVKDVEIKGMDELEMSYYLRFSAMDRPGVLSTISGVLGSHNISISSVIQKGRQAGGAVPLVIITHNAVERELRSAIKDIEKLDVIKDEVRFIRIEEGPDAA